MGCMYVCMYSSLLAVVCCWHHPFSLLDTTDTRWDLAASVVVSDPVFMIEVFSNITLFYLLDNILVILLMSSHVPFISCWSFWNITIARASYGMLEGTSQSSIMLRIWCYFSFTARAMRHQIRFQRHHNLCGIFHFSEVNSLPLTQSLFTFQQALKYIG